jgi:DNA mismatch endonuclease (patch repair protein)
MPNRGPKDSTPEATLRRRLHAAGLRFARSARGLPGPPDIVLPRRRSVILVRGCFWHGHDCPQGRAAPKFHVGSWAEKIAANRESDQNLQAALQDAGWQVETVWECQIEQPQAIDTLAARLRER